MYELNLADNITRLRHERKITQEELADFIGVTKASVSKWENAQSMPDLMLLLQLAAFFDVTVDGLLGYEPKLSPEQIRRCYAGLSKDFAKLPVDEVFEKAGLLARRYYSCYPLLLELGILYLNHYMLVREKEEQTRLLEEAAGWCGHILENCDDVGVCGDALILKAVLNLQLGRTKETIEALEPSVNPDRLSGQEGVILTQAYCMAGEEEKAKSYIQIKEYQDLLNLTGDAVLSLSVYKNDMERCEKTIERINGVMEKYQLEQLHPNMAAQFHYQSAAVYALNGRDRDALHALERFESCINMLLHAEQPVLHGDAYFDRLDRWIGRLPLGEMAPRDKAFVGQNIKEALSHPVFHGIKEEKEFQKIVRRLTKGGKNHD